MRFRLSNTLFYLLLGLFIFALFPQSLYAQTPTGTVVFDDKFTDVNGKPLQEHNPSWVLGEGASAEIQNNTLFAASESFLTNSNILTDQCVSYDVEFPLSGLVGLYVRRNFEGSASYYTFINPGDNGLGLGWTFSGAQGFLATVYDAIPSSGWHNFKLCAIGTDITTLIDNIIVASGIDDKILQGNSSIILGQGNYIDNFLLESFETIPTPTSTPTTTPTPTLTPTPTPNITVPKVVILYPRNNSKINNNSRIEIIAGVFSRQKIKKVDFYVNNNLICSDTHLFYTCNWKVPKGKGITYSLTVKAYDVAGSVSISKATKIVSK